MSFKLRFALRFTSSVAVILLICFVGIYVVYANYRAMDFSSRVRSEGLEVYRLLSKLNTDGEKDSLNLIRDIHNNILPGEEILIIDSSQKHFFKLPENLDTSGYYPIIASVSKGKGVELSINDRQFIAIQIPETSTNIIVSGIDESGLVILDQLKWILIVVYVVALILIAFISFLLSNQVSKPLLDLGKQMQETSIVDLRKRIPENASFTEVNIIARNFNAMLERLEKTFEFQRSFVHHASHELRTPLATMLSHTESALNNKLSEEEFRTVLASLKQDQERMIELTNSLLLISQFEQQGFDQSWPICRVDEMLYDKISISMKMYPDIGISLVFLNTPTSDNDLTVRGNEALLKSMFSNLIRNAYLYSMNKKVEILLEIAEKDVFIHVENKGEHLSIEEREKIMMPFFRGQHARQKAAGVGLGLTIVQRILNMHKGALIYTPMPNQTNRFTVSLPKSED